MSIKVLIVKGTTAHKSRLASVADIAHEAAEQTGGDVRVWDLVDSPLPVMSLTDPRQRRLPEVVRVREAAAEADGFIFITPEYHGNMSGALKNWFDFLYSELAGKFAGVVATTGGGTGDMSITAVKTCFSWCHGFVLPFHAAASPTSFVADVLTDATVMERIERVGHDVVRYAPVLREAFERARELPGTAGGFAGLHAKD